MAIRKIIKLGDPILKTKSKKVEKVNDSIRQLIKDLLHTMYNAPGVGLAANQIGVPLQVCVVDVRVEDKNNPLVFINPQIHSKKGSLCAEEGCLSVPGVFASVKRAEHIVISALNELGKEFTIEASGYLARAIQHELDHLSGIVFVDKLSPFKKVKVKLLIRRLKKEKKW